MIFQGVANECFLLLLLLLKLSELLQISVISIEHSMKLKMFYLCSAESVDPSDIHLYIPIEKHMI